MTANEIIKHLENNVNGLDYFEVSDEEVLDLINRQKAEIEELQDVAEVKHGEWIYHECVSSHDGAKSGFSCSECCGFVDEEIFDMDEFNKAFCGACGAKMDGQ